MIARLHQAIEALRRWRAGLSPRERAGLALLAVLLAAFAAFQSFDWAMSAQARVEQARKERLRMAAVASRHMNADWRGAVAQNAGKVWSWSVVETTESIARARAIAELEALVAGAGIADASVRAVPSDGPAAPAPMTAMEYVIEGGFDWTSLLMLLGAMKDSPISMTPVSAEVSAGESGDRFTLVVRLAYLDEDMRT